MVVLLFLPLFEFTLSRTELQYLQCLRFQPIPSGLATASVRSVDRQHNRERRERYREKTALLDDERQVSSVSSSGVDLSMRSSLQDHIVR